MTPKEQFAVDARTGERRDMERGPKRSSATGPWKGFLLQEWEDQPAMNGEIVIPMDVVVLQLGPADFEESVDNGPYYRPQEGSTRVIPANVPVSVRGRSGGHLLALTIDPQWLRLLVSESGASGHTTLRPQRELDDPVVDRLMRALADEVEEGYPGGRIYGESLVQSLVVRLLTLQGTLLTPREPARGQLGRAALEKVFQHIEANLGDDLSLAELAGVANLSAFYFARAFRRSTGQSPHAYVIRRRVERARSLLLSYPDKSIADVAVSVGFADQSHLTAHFRRVFGVTPGVYIRQNRTR